MEHEACDLCEDCPTCDGGRDLTLYAEPGSDGARALLCPTCGGRALVCSEEVP